MIDEKVIMVMKDYSDDNKFNNELRKKIIKDFIKPYCVTQVVLMPTFYKPKNLEQVVDFTLLHGLFNIKSFLQDHPQFDVFTNSEGIVRINLEKDIDIIELLFGDKYANK